MEIFTNGMWVDTSKIPAFLGRSLKERLFRWMRYAKSGIFIFDVTQE